MHVSAPQYVCTVLLPHLSGFASVSPCQSSVHGEAAPDNSIKVKIFQCHVIR